jgi:hypothetical protein
MFSKFSTCWFNLSDALDISVTNWALFSAVRLLLLAWRLSVAPIIVAIGVLNSWDNEFNNVLYNLTALAFSSFCLAIFSTCLTL